jgi:signal transduction histidine kinase
LRINEVREGVHRAPQHEPDGSILISVSDTGIRVTPEQADKIFDAFFTTKTQGTGMGLSISRSIIESHGGRLWATINSDRGATFQFTLPGVGERLISTLR